MLPGYNPEDESLDFPKLSANIINLNPAYQRGQHFREHYFTIPEAVTVCRICMEEEDCDSLCHLGCKCQGELGLVHEQCIQQWYKCRSQSSGKSRNNVCEVCGDVSRNILVPENSETTFVKEEGGADSVEAIDHSNIQTLEQRTELERLTSRLKQRMKRVFRVTEACFRGGDNQTLP